MAEAQVPEIMPNDDAPASALELVAAGATLMRIENETMMAVAVQRPRNERRILEKALEELDLVPRLATRCFYSIPYKDRGETVYVTGASVNTARNIARRWGNCASKTMLTGEDDDKVVLAGVFTDLETNVRFERVFTVSKWQHRRGGSPYRLSNERLMMAVQAGASKAERNAIISGLPDWLVQSYYDKARAIAAKDARDEGKVSKITQSFLELSVTREMLETHLHKKLDALDADDLANLRGLLNALRDKEVTVDDVFAPKPNGTAPSTGTVDDVIAGGAKVTAGAEKGTKQEDQAPAKAAPKADPEPTPAKAAPAQSQQSVDDWFSGVN